MADLKLSELLADAIKHVPEDKQKAILNHPDTPGVAEKLIQALTTPKDVMSPQEQLAYKQSGAEDTSTSTDTVSNEDKVRYQAINDIANAAAAARSSQPESAKKAPGVGENLSTISNLVLDSANKAIESMHGTTLDYVKNLTAAVRDANSLNSK